MTEQRLKHFHRLLTYLSITDCVDSLEGGDRGGHWYRYQLIRYQVPPKLKVLVPPILWEGAIMNMTNSERRSTSVLRETNEQDQTTPEHVTVTSVSLSAL